MKIVNARRGISHATTRSPRVVASVSLKIPRTSTVQPGVRQPAVLLAAAAAAAAAAAMAFPPERAANPEHGRHLSFPPPHHSSAPREPHTYTHTHHSSTIASASRANDTWYPPASSLTYTPIVCRLSSIRPFLSCLSRPNPSFAPCPSPPLSRFGFHACVHFLVFWGGARCAAVKLCVHDGPRRINVCSSCEQKISPRNKCHHLPGPRLFYLFLFASPRLFADR